MDDTMLEKVSVAARFAKVEPQRFADELDQRVQWIAKLVEPVKDAVEEGILNPIDGLALSSCITGRLFGYEEFHGSQPIANALLTGNAWRHDQTTQRDRSGATARA